MGYEWKNNKKILRAPTRVVRLWTRRFKHPPVFFSSRGANRRAGVSVRRTTTGSMYFRFTQSSVY
jgi:hypothetical protein